MEVVFHKAFRSSEFVRNSLAKSGFVVNQEKSAWYPITNMTWLGINLDFDNKKFSISTTVTKIIQSLLYTTIQLFEH